MTTVRLLTLLALWVLKKPAPEVAAVRRLSLARTPLHLPIDRRARASGHCLRA